MKAPTGDDSDLAKDYGLKRFLAVDTDGDDNDWESDNAAYDGDEDDVAGTFSLSSSSVTSSRRVRNYVQRQNQRRQRRRYLCGAAVLVLVAVTLASAIAMLMAGGAGRRNDAAAPSSPDAQTTTSADPAEASSGGNSGNNNASSNGSNYVDDDKASAVATYEDNDDDDGGDDDTAGVAPTAFVRPDANELESYCGYSLTLSEGFDMCRSKCELSACCRIPTGVEGSCTIEHADDCQVYKTHCSVLDHKQDQQQQQSAGGTVTGPAHYGNYNRHKSAGGGSSTSSSLPYDDDHMTDDPAMQYKLIGPAPDDISQVCSMDRMSASLDNVRACASYCVHAFCCYDRAPYDCRDVQPLCANYVDPCTNLQNKLQEP